MARKSRKENVKSTSGTAISGVRDAYRAAVYVRLSKEDERKVESESVENQIAFLQDYVEKDDTLALTGTYVDRNISGTKFDRPEFNRMIADVRSGKINCVVVKDLSRLGRNYLEAGDYIEKIFPFFGVRFIAVTDNYDSLTSEPTEDGFVVPLKNLINEAYAKDISRKICSSMENKYRQGIYAGTSVAYGYIRDPQDAHNLLVNEAVREVVVRIFGEFANGRSLYQIAGGLNEDGIPAPAFHRIKKETSHSDKLADMWNSDSVRKILQNPVYTGDVQLAKTQRCYYKGITKPVKRTDGYYVQEHHEAIIGHEIFNKARERLQKNREEYQASLGKYGEHQNRKEDLFQGILYCGHCGRRMNLYRKTKKLANGIGHYSSYICRRSRTYGEADPNKNVKAENLEILVMELIKAHIAVYVDAKDRLQKLNRKPHVVEVRMALEQKLTELEERESKIRDFIGNLYVDFSDGIFYEKEYLEMKARYVKELESLRVDREKLQTELDTYDEKYCGSEQMKTAFEKYLGTETLNRELVQALIREITCYSKERFEVEYTFGDELAALVDLVQKRGADVT